MLINLRNALMTKRLPYDNEIEFLESTGTQYINTLVNADSNLSVEITMANAGTPWTNTNPTGAILATPRCRHHLNFNNDENIYGINYFLGNGDYCFATSGRRTTNGEIFTFKVDAINKTFALGSSLDTFPNDTFDTGLSYWLFGRNGTTPPYLGSLRIYSAKLWSGSVLVRDFIPVRKGTVGYLYDRVSGKLFGNAGTGDFVLGPDVVPVEYIESHGTEWIDTDKSVDLPMHLEADINFTNPNTGSNVQTLVGGYNASLENQRFWVTSLPQGKINCALLKNSISANLVPANRKVHLVVDFENGRQTATIDGVQYTSASQSTTNYWFRNWKLRIFQSFGTVVASNNIPLQAITNRINIDIGASQALRLLSVRVGTEGAMMDVLTRRIYRNAGTGAFGYGNDLKYPIPAE